MTEAPGTHNPQFLPPNIRCLSRCRRPKAHRSICRSSVAGLLFMSIRGVPGVDTPDGWTRSLEREAARRSRAHSTIISASSRAWASRSSMVCRHRTPPIRRRRPRGCTCRLRFCRTRSSRSPATSISRHFPPSSSAWRLSSMTAQSPRSSTRFSRRTRMLRK